jgi:hypothetical protein
MSRWVIFLGFFMPVEINGQIFHRTLEACKKTGISRATLLRWLKGGVIEEPIRDRRGWRVFSDEDLRRIQVEANRTEGRRDHYSTKHRGANENTSEHLNSVK